MKKIVILTGAGISAESGLRTFRDSDGLWEGHRVEDVATFNAWQRNPQMVLDFYNQRRADALATQPNAAHIALVELEKKYELNIITQNVDDLHERAGALNVLHLHGMLNLMRSTTHEELIYPILTNINLGDTCENGSQLRPHIVWFGEDVPMLSHAAAMAAEADIFIVIGTSLAVYPANTLAQYAPRGCKFYFVDPKAAELMNNPHWTLINEKATTGVRKLVDELMGV